MELDNILILEASLAWLADLCVLNVWVLTAAIYVRAVISLIQQV